MKALLINGSPHEKGCTYTALHEMEQVLQAARDRKATQIRNFDGYGPEQVQLLNQSALRSDDVYVLFAVSDHASDIKKAYRKDLFQTE